MKPRTAHASHVLRLCTALCLACWCALIAAAPLEPNEFLADPSHALTEQQRKDCISQLTWFNEAMPLRLGMVISADAGLSRAALPDYAERALMEWRPRPNEAAHSVLLVIQVPTKQAHFAVGEALRARFPADLMQRAVAERVQPYLDDGDINLAVDRAYHVVYDLKDGHIPADLLPKLAPPVRPLYQRIAPFGPKMLIAMLVVFVGLQLWAMFRYATHLHRAFIFGLVGAVTGLVAWLLQIPKPWPGLLALAIGFFPLTLPAVAKTHRWAARAGSGGTAPSGVAGSSGAWPALSDSDHRKLQNLFRGRLPWSPRYSRGLLAAVNAHIAQAATRHDGRIVFHAQARLSLRQVMQRRLLDLARDEFVMQRVWDTPRSNGVLIHVLAAERRMVLVADRGIAMHVPEERWDAICAEAEAALARGEFERGAIIAVDGVAALLREYSARRDS